MAAIIINIVWIEPMLMPKINRCFHVSVENVLKCEGMVFNISIRAMLIGLLGISPAVAARAENLKVVFVTEIRDVSLGSFQVGEKSRQTITIDTTAKTMTQAFSTGVTNVAGIKLGSVRDSFKLTSYKFNGQMVSFSVKGTTGSAVSFFGDIDYRFDISLNTASKVVTFSGCHNEYPSYYIIINEKKIYDRRQSGAVLTGALMGDCDINVASTTSQY